MNRKLLIGAVSGWLLSGVLLVEFGRLAQDFKTLHNKLEEQNEIIGTARKLVTNELFYRIVESNDL